MRAESTYKLHPVVMAALAVHRLDVDDLPWVPAENSMLEEVDTRGTMTQPSIVLHSDGSAVLRWFREDGHVSYQIESDGYAVVTLERRTTPQSVLSALPGRPLSDVVDMPGADATTMIEGVNSRAFISDPEDTRISVVPVGLEPVPAEMMGFRS